MTCERKKYWKEKFITINESKQLGSWGKYRLRFFEKRYFITERSRWTNNSHYEHIVIEIPICFVTNLLTKKRLTIKYISKIRSEIKFEKMMYDTFKEDENNV